MRAVSIHASAAEEAVEAAAWYEHERSGLGTDFRRAIDAALDLLGDGQAPSTPMPGRAGNAGIRRLILKRFPYDLVFVERGETVIVLAFAHHSRKPGFWRERLRS